MFTVGVQVGRLLEVRLITPVTLQDLEQVSARLDEIYAQHGAVVIVADYTRATVLSQEVAAMLAEIFKRANAWSVRSAALVSESAVFSLQVERLIAKAENPLRRSFRDPFELRAFLGAVLTHVEHVRLLQFLGEEP